MKLFISATLRPFFNQNDTIDISGKSIREVLLNLLDEYPDAKNVVLDEKGELRQFVQLFVNRENRSSIKFWDDAFVGDPELLLLPSIAGGAPERPLISDERRKQVGLDDEDIERYSKNLTLREIGVKGQKKLKAAKVVVVGAGAIGSPAILYLAAAGVGAIKVIDDDDVAVDNVQCQILHTARDIKRPKVASAKDSVKNINRKIAFEAVYERITAENALALIEGYDLVLDCSDNYPTRYLINDACYLAGVPLVFGSVFQFEGRVGVFNFNGGACYRCLFPAPPDPALVPTCAAGGLSGPIAGIVGSVQAGEAIKLLTDVGDVLNDKLLVIDSLHLHSTVLEVEKNETCPLCGANRTIQTVEEIDYEDFCGLSENEDEEPIEMIEPEDFVKRIESGEPISVVDVREPHERAALRFPNAIAIPIGQLARRQKELNSEQDAVFVCKEGKRSILAIRTLREAGYKGPMLSLKGGIEATRDVVFSREGAWL